MQSGQVKAGIRALILLPTRDLCDQIDAVLSKLTHYCRHLISHTHIAGDIPFETQKHRLADQPTILVSTPGRLVQHLEKRTVELSKSLDIIVVDEADLILSYGYKEDVEKIAKHLPKICQGFLMSATLTPEVEGLKKLILHTPVLLKLEEEEMGAANLTQYAVQIPENDKFLLLYVLLKMKLIRGKTLVFVNDINRCFKLKLFLDRMVIKSAVMNAELPQNSRQHTIDQFNKGVFDLLIASDENAGVEDSDDEDEEDETSEEQKEPKKSKAASKSSGSSKKVSKSKRQDDEYGISRGMDFQDVVCVVNFDFPLTSSSYVHRIGRTARAGKVGVSLSFMTDSDVEVARKVEVRLAEESQVMKPYTFKMNVLEGFRYRVDDVLRSVTKQSIKEARFQEVKLEMLNSDKLKSFFEENPRDLDTLKHTKALLTTRRFEHLKNVPSYMIPTREEQEESLPAVNLDEEYNAAFGYKKPVKRTKRKRDPLKDFSFVSKPEKAKRQKRSGPSSDAMADGK